MSKKNTITVGEVRLIPFKVNKNTVYFNCIVLDTRRAYGRSEVKVAPRDGSDESVWLTEDTVLGRNGLP